MTIDQAMSETETLAYLHDLRNEDAGRAILAQLPHNATHRDLREYVLAQQARIDALASTIADE